MSKNGFQWGYELSILSQMIAWPGGCIPMKIFYAFVGKIEVQGNYLQVEIDGKPLLIPCSLIESSVKDHVANLNYLWTNKKLNYISK